MSPSNRIVSPEDWTEARKVLLAKERAFTHARDALSAARRTLPMVKVEKTYVFEAPNGKQTLAELFGGKQQLIVYHFMFGPDWEEGCKSCSYVANNFQGSIVHLAARDTAFTAISRAPIEKIEAFKKRMGWTFPWVSSFDTSFNYDFHVSFRPDEFARKEVEYNYSIRPFPQTEAPGVSVFLRQGDDVFHTYSTYERGLDLLIGTYNYLDLTPLGRNEEELSYPMAWVRHHDKYEPSSSSSEGPRARMSAGSNCCA